MLIEPGSKLLLIGDSITDCGRARPVAEGNEVGNGYVSQINALLGALYPADGIRVFNMGVNGNTVRDLKARWRKDVLDQQPEWLVIFIGINDVYTIQYLIDTFQFLSIRIRCKHIERKHYVLLYR